MDRGGDLAVERRQGFGQAPRRTQPGVEFGELIAGWQVAVQEQEGGLLVRDDGGQVLDPVAAILQPPEPSFPSRLAIADSLAITPSRPG